MMLRRISLVIVCSLICNFDLQAQKKEKKLSPRKDHLVVIITGLGKMTLVLSDQTPRHKANFVKLAGEGFYDGLLFHRVIENFMIQGGDPNSRNAGPEVLLGSGRHGENIPAEFVPELFHKRGVIAAARDNNPEKSSSGCQFYIVHGRKWSEEELDKQIQRAVRKPDQDQKSTYLSVGGTPHLDGNYTVFGEVIDGLEVIDKIASVKTNPQNRPREDVKMEVKVEVWKKKKISKTYNYRY